MLPDAEAEFERQFDYLWERSPQGANAGADAVDKAVGDLRQTADMHELAPESTDHPFDVFSSRSRQKMGTHFVCSTKYMAQMFSIL